MDIHSEDNRVFVTGDNSLGQLGTGDTSERKEFTPVHSQSLKNKNIVNVCCGEFFTAIATGMHQQRKNDPYSL